MSAQTRTTNARETIAEVICSGNGSLFIRVSCVLPRVGVLLSSWLRKPEHLPWRSTSATDALQTSGDLVVFATQPFGGIDKRALGLLICCWPGFTVAALR